MISKKIFIVLLLALTTFIGCKNDTEEFVVNDENLYTSSIVGIVTDENNNPISGATIDFKGQTTSTDQFGVYEINNVKIGDQHNFLAITKNGYFDGCRTFRTIEKRVLSH